MTVYKPPERVTLRQLAARVLMTNPEAESVDRMLEAWRLNPGSARRWAHELRVELELGAD